jgi:hypothetical protein
MNSSSTFGQAYAGVRQYLLKDRRKKVYIIGGVLLIAGLLWAGYLEGGETVETAGTTHGHGETHGTTDTQQDMNFLERVKRGLFSGHFVKEHLIHLTSAIIIGFIVLLFLKGDEKIDEEHRELLLLERMKRAVGGELDSLKNELVHKGLPDLVAQIEQVQVNHSRGLTFMHIEHGLPLVTSYLRTAVEGIRVIGTAKSELPSTPQIEAYMEATEQALHRQGSAVKYRRITTYRMEEGLRRHLEACLKANGKAAQHDTARAQVVLMDDFAAANTFVIVDDRFIFISPTAQDRENLEVSMRCFISKDPEVIAVYRKHFEQTYDKAKRQSRTLTVPAELHPDNMKALREVMQTMDDLKGRVAELGKRPQWQLEYSKKAVNEVMELVMGLDSLSFNIEHQQTYSNLLETVSFLIGQMNKGDTYETMSLVPFWVSGHTETVFRKFIQANERAIGRGAELWRTLIMDWSQLSGPGAVAQYQDAAKRALLQNLKWAHSSNYHFSILFVEKGDALESKLFEYAKVKLGADVIVLRPDNKYHATSTKLSHYPVEPQQQLIRTAKQRELDEIDADVADYREKLAGQVITAEQRKFLDACIVLRAEEWLTYTQVDLRKLGSA